MQKKGQKQKKKKKKKLTTDENDGFLTPTVDDIKNKTIRARN